MTVTELRSNLHHLIDKIKSEELLEAIHDLLKQKEEGEEGALFNSLTEVEKKELLDAEEGSHNDSNMIDNEVVMKKYKKWL